MPTCRQPLRGFGVSSAYIGMVGNDAFGKYLTSVLHEKGVDTSEIAISNQYNTTLAFVHLFDNGERDFSFYRKPGADIMYTPDLLNAKTIKNAQVFHFGSLSLTDEPARSATFKALEIAKENGVVISYDPNYRAPLWESGQQAKLYMLKGMEYADIVKISDNEIAFLFGHSDYEKAAESLLNEGAKLVFVTLGSKGAIYAHASGTGRAAGFWAKAVDATGAGDCFTAGVLSQYICSGKNLSQLTQQEVDSFARFANAAASICVEGRGGIPSLPTRVQVETRLKRG